MRKQVFFIFAAILYCTQSQAGLSMLAKPYLQNMQPTEVTIAWTSTGSTNAHGWVEYGTSAINRQAFEEKDGLVMAYTNIYRVRLTNLQPNTTYQYKVICRIAEWATNSSISFGEQIESEVYTFTTPAGNESVFECLVYSGVRNKTEKFASLLSTNSLNVTDYAFVILGGDNLLGVTSESQVNSELIVPMADLLQQKIPYYMARGNREYRQKLSRHLKDFFITPGSADLHPYYYTFTYGHCMFIVLDPGDTAEDADAVYKELNTNTDYLNQQAQWLNQVIASDAYKTAAYHVAILHHEGTILDPIVKSANMNAVLKGEGDPTLTVVSVNSQGVTTQTYK